ncbi:hypothetical protein TeGR_g522 [Tetraparma gracilis]|uniref:PH domain-containing protein n=1 Tax=Tetraparma gracilis TaxID=2962635 RepID=A0ABQ6MHV4_9STRA|nr:hypothetical protein TeGR_g522 [Tetraparma gracilis]
MHVDRSARRALAIQHIYDGQCSFQVEAASGPGTGSSYGAGALRLTEAGVEYGDLRVPYAEWAEWSVSDDDDAAQPAFTIAMAGAEPFRFTLLADAAYSLPSLLHLRHCVEFFWNQHLQINGLPALQRTTHGRGVAQVFTLQGHQDPPPVPLGTLDVLNGDGQIVAGFSNERNRRASSVGRESVDGRSSTGSVIGSGKFESIRRNTSGSTARRTSFFGKSEGPAVERPGARDCWKYVTKHQGWLSKKGGIGPTGKKWLDRYFVLYSTAMGHYLSYYSSHADSPLFSDKRAERNLIDLGKVTFLRPVSNQPDAPLYSFDVVTIEREWTLCARDEKDMQLWLQLLTTAVDEDVAIVPDDELCFEVKTLKDPSDRLIKFDYSTVIKVSAYGVSVGTRNNKFEYHERFFWCYTDFYKWSVQNQFGKLTLFVSVFTSNDFSQASKLDFEFRTRQAVQLASAIEFYIEKFMSIMYLRNEGNEDAEDGHEGGRYASDDEYGDDAGGEIVADDDEPDSIQASVDLLSLDSEEQVAVAVAVSPSSGGGDFAVADAVVSPPPPAQQSGGFDPFMDQPPAPPGGGDFLDAFTTPAPSSTKVPPASSLANMRDNAIPSLLKAKPEGMLYSEPGVINVMVKQEWRGSQGRVSVCFVNAGSSAITTLAASLEPVTDNSAALRSQLSEIPNGGTLQPGEQAVQQIMVECMQPFETMPQFSLSFKIGGTSHDYPLTLPIVLNCFFEPTAMEGDDFMSRWQKLNNPALQQQEAVTSKTPTLNAFVEQVMGQMKMAVISSLSEKSGGICAVGTLRTGMINASGGKISVGVLCRVEINAAAQAYRITVRTAHAGVSKIVKDSLKERLLGAQ